MYNRIVRIVLSGTILSGLFLSIYAAADVPSVRYRRPDIPGFLQSMNFQTVGMQVFPPEVSGMVPDRISDLSWNPAFLAGSTDKTAYLDYQFMESLPVFSSQGTGIQFNNVRTAASDRVMPEWYAQTSVRSVQTVPLYNLGILFPISRKLKIGLFNRTVFDYGPFLQGYGNAWESGNYYDKTSGGSLAPQRLETDHNQQTVLGNQLELVFGYRLSEKWDAGLRLGHMFHDRHGDMIDDRWAFYPHSSSGNLEEESLKIRGHHLEAGLGLLFHPDSMTHIGIYAGMSSGNGSESSVMRDTSRSWSERDVNPKYYDKNYALLNSNQTFKEDGRRPQVTFTFEKHLSRKWLLRSFVSASWSDVNVSGILASDDTTAWDRTYDYYEYNSGQYFRRLRGHGSRSSRLDGNGTEKNNLQRGFVSLAYAPQNTWSMFGGFYVQRLSYTQKLTEESGFRSHRWNEYTLYKFATDRNANRQELRYNLKSAYSLWSVYLPVGFRMKIAPRLTALIGGGVAFALEDQNAEGERLYPILANQIWENNSLIVNDLEINRVEVFSSDPAKTLNRQWTRSFGLAYQHPSGAQVYLKFADDFSKMGNWAFGFEKSW